MNLSQKMQDLEIHVLETELAGLKARTGNPLAEPMLAALARIVEHAQIVEAYVTPNPVSEARKWDQQRGWTLVVFREKPITETQTEIAEAMATGIQVWPISRRTEDQERAHLLTPGAITRPYEH